jgi:hypothetical protein
VSSIVPSKHLRLAEAGLLFVVLVLAALLTVFGGSVERPLFETGPDGERRRVFTEDADGNRTAAKERVNKFLNAENLTQLAKDTSFFAIMAVGLTCRGCWPPRCSTPSDRKDRRRRRPPEGRGSVAPCVSEQDCSADWSTAA